MEILTLIEKGIPTKILATVVAAIPILYRVLQPPQY